MPELFRVALKLLDCPAVHPAKFAPHAGCETLNTAQPLGPVFTDVTFMFVNGSHIVRLTVDIWPALNLSVVSVISAPMTGFEGLS